ncbi:hypothetical protein GGS23DRAFT_591970 [Durotheca rogersii]|uniref:uncharacterized protein n=1 Tax=Durotheca rogersii TaxID=419775 RepID=UPI00221EC180|nr:uncharacterized protein GGS23DRAFT_591970 [Durotheca rogersii]KAI5868176.1 hypothetical protein GGS23DRAFT_591970 [Durotheca rogersii]
MQLPPPSVIASWPEPNFVDPVVRGEAGMVVGLLISVLVTVTLAIRFYARKFLTRGFGLDDIFILLAYLPATAFTLIGVIEEKTSQGNRHTWDVELNPLVTILKLALANSILFELATSLTKLSMLALFYRLTTASRDWKMTIIVLTSIVFISLNSLIFIMVSICQCTPLSEYWRLSFEPQNCINRNVHLMAASIITTVTDFLVVLLPIKITTGLDLPPKQSRVVICLFGIGFIASSVGIARTYFTWVLTTDFDLVWNAWAVWFTSTVELNLDVRFHSGHETILRQHLTRYLRVSIQTTFILKFLDGYRLGCETSQKLADFNHLHRPYVNGVIHTAAPGAFPPPSSLCQPQQTATPNIMLPAQQPGDATRIELRLIGLASRNA